MLSLIARRCFPVLGLVFLLAGCDTIVMRPFGDVAAQQADLIRVSTYLMLLIIVPVIVLTVLFAWRYRSSNTSAKYTPDWDHSTQLELVIWGAPLLIIIALGLLTWISTHLLDPYRPVQRLDPARPLAEGVRPMEVQVVALDWKWLFIYPEQGVASVNELVTPIDVPVHFRITASTVMNSFYIPALAGQVYAMPGMETSLHAVLNKAGTYEGFSANYSGAGFSDMRFRYQGVPVEDFERWVQKTKEAGGNLTRADYQTLEKPSERVPAQRFAAYAPGLFDAIVNRCVAPGTTCMKDSMGHGAGHGHAAGSAAQFAAQSPVQSAAKAAVEPASQAKPAEHSGKNHAMHTAAAATAATAAHTSSHLHHE